MYRKWIMPATYRCQAAVAPRWVGCLIAAQAAAFSCNTDLTSLDAGVSTPREDGVVCAPLSSSAATPPPVMDLPDHCTDSLAAQSPHAPSSPLGLAYPDVTSGLPEHTAYLTFDDGPSEWTAEFLDILKDRGVHATFFITGKQFKGAAGLQGTFVDQHGVTQVYESLLKRELDEGHDLANHTVNHPDLGLLSDDQIAAEVDDDELEINAALVRIGEHPRVLSLFRPPMGSPWFTGAAEKMPLVGERSRVGQRIATHGLNVLWNLTSTDAQDWALDESYSRTKPQQPTAGAPSFAAKVERIKQAVLKDPLVAKGAGLMILMHDTHPTTLKALPELIDGLKAAGYSFGKVEEAVIARWGRPSYQLTPGPSLYAPCTPERNWGCLDSGAVDSQGKPLEICGRVWAAYTALGGSQRLGKPLRQASQDDMGLISQAFERGTVELHPENAPPCNVIIRER